MMVSRLQFIQPALFLLLSFVGLQQADEESDPKFPSIWTGGQNGGASEDAVYRIRAEVELSGSGKSFVVEEWASGISETFRLDMIETVSGKRSTCLTFGRTNESFYYEPFQCKLVENFNNVLDKELADKLQPSDMRSQFIPIGIGALYIHALKLESSHSKPSSRGNCNLTSDGAGDGLRAQSALDCLESYTVHANSDYLYDLTFYFRANKIALGPESLFIIAVRKLIDHGSEPLMRIKILEFESSLKNALQESPDLFDLPPGYGCKRSDKIEVALDAPVNVLGSDMGPNVFRLDIVAQLPVDEENDHQLNKWRSHSTSVRLVAGRVTLSREKQRDYLIIEKRELVPDKRLSGRRATLRRARQVWDLGTGGLEPRPADSPEKGRKIYYELEDQLGKCLAFGESSQREAGASIDFSGPTNNSISSPEFQEETDYKPKVSGLMLDISLLKIMFGSPTGYHQIRKTPSPVRANLIELIYEKRLEKFELRSQQGQLIWSGPVSFVRKDLRKSRQVTLHDGLWTVDQPEASVAIHFLSREADRLVGKVQLALNERRTINQASFHHELSVEPCLSGHRKAGKGAAHLEFKVNYPLESDSVADRLANCGHCQTMAQEQFLRALYNVSNGLLDPLQVDRISLEVIGADLLKVSARVMARPISLNYRRESGVRFSSARKSLLFSELQPDHSGCAESCSHYNCSAFAYCETSDECDLFMSDTGLLSKMGTEPATGCSLFWNHDNLNNNMEEQYSRAPEPAELMHQMREAIAKTGQDQFNPLAIWMHNCEEHGNNDNNNNEFNQLLPVSIETLRDVLVDAGEASSSGTNLLRAEYELVLENRRFGGKQASDLNQLPVSIFPVPQAKHMSYEDCRALCEQTDCKSFSHCRIDRTCIVSQLHDSGIIREHSERDDYCFVFARDWLSKFGPPLEVALPPANTKTNKPLRVHERRDCASRCMDEMSFKCRSFYHCKRQSDSESANCYLSKRHPQASKTLQIPPMDTNKTTCQLYTRSHLADFEKFHGKSLPEAAEGAAEGVSQIVKRSLGAEACALECAENLGHCQAFHVCRIQSGTRTLEPICVLLPKTPNSQTDWLGPEKLVANERCTSFIVGPQSELRQSLSDPKNFKPLEDDNNYGDSDSELDSHAPTASNRNWLLYVILVLIGLCIGHGLALVWRCRY